MLFTKINKITDVANFNKALLGILKIFEHYLAKHIFYWGNLQCCKWPSIEN